MRTLFNYMLVIYPALLLFITFKGAVRAKKDEFNDEYLELKHAKMIQAFACLAIIIHHITQLISQYGAIDKGPITKFCSFGILFTSIFFFYSGYGLMISYRCKENYLKNFLSHRLSTVLVPFFTANITFVIVRYLHDGRVGTSKLVARYLFGIQLINSNGWFIVEIVCLYLAFYILFSICRHKDLALVILSVLTVMLIFYSKSRGHDTDLITPNSRWYMGEWWYNSTIVFVMGLWYGRFKDGLTAFWQRGYRAKLIVTTILLIIVFEIEEFILGAFGYYKESATIDRISNSSVTLAAQMVLCLVWVMFVLLISMKIRLNSRILIFIGAISNELFLIHNIFVRELFGTVTMPDMVRYALVYACSIPLAYLLARLNKLILGVLKNIPTEKIKIPKKALIITFAIIIAVILMVLVIPSAKRYLGAEKECQQEIEALKEAKEGDIVAFGRYDCEILPGDERVDWIVAAVDGETYTLVSEYGLLSCAYQDKHEEVSWQNSDLRKRLNETEYQQIFSEYEQEYIVANEAGDRLSIPTAKEAATFFAANEDRVLAATAVAKNRGANVNTMSKVNYWDTKETKSSWWWLRDDTDNERIQVDIVSNDGEIVPDGKYVNKPNGAVRLTVIVKTK